MRLIDADPLYADIQKHFEDLKEQRENAEDEDLRGMLCGEIIENRKLGRKLRNAPTIDAVPVVHARWKMTDSPYCSHCNRVSVLKYRYCPSCGARMDGDPHGSGQ